MYGLWGLPFIPKYVRNRPSFIGTLTWKYIYDLLPNVVVEKIEDKTEEMSIHNNPLKISLGYNPKKNGVINTPFNRLLNLNG